MSFPNPRRVCRHAKWSLVLALFFCCATAVFAGDPVGTRPADQKDVSYLESSTDDYAQDMGKLDVYLPSNVKDFPLLVWFHGGLLTQGDKTDHARMARILADQGVGVVLPNYRLSPKVKFPVYIEDCAQAVGWAKANAARLGADPDKLFIGGYSAGAYLAAMLAMDQHFLREIGIDPLSLRGVICKSGMMATPISVRAEHGIGPNTILSDEAAPLYHTRDRTPPIFLFVADSDKPARLEENQYFTATLKAAGNKKVQFQIFADRNHSTISDLAFTPGDPVGPAMLQFVKDHLAASQEK